MAEGDFLESYEDELGTLAGAIGGGVHSKVAGAAAALFVKFTTGSTVLAQGAESAVARAFGKCFANNPDARLKAAAAEYEREKRKSAQRAEFAEIVESVLVSAVQVLNSESEQRAMVRLERDQELERTLFHLFGNVFQRMEELRREVHAHSGGAHTEEQPSDQRPRALDRLTRMVEDHAFFAGRANLLSQLSHFVRERSRGRALLLAPTGFGKSAALIHWVRLLEESKPYWPVFAPISRAYQHAEPREVLGRILSGLQRCYCEPNVAQPTSATHAPSLIADYLRRPPPLDRRLVLVIDGLDEAIGWKVGRAMFPREFAERVFVVASARERANCDKESVCEQLGWRKSETSDFSLDLFELAEVREALELAGFAELTTNDTVFKRVCDLTHRDPFWLKRVVEKLQANELTSEMLLDDSPIRLPGYDLTDLVASAADPAIHALLCVLCTAQEALSEAEIRRELVPDILKNKTQVGQAAAVVDRWISGMGSGADGYLIKQPRIREQLVEMLMDESDQKAFHRRFGAWGDRCLAANPIELPHYLRKYWIAHLESAGQWGRLQQVLSDVTTEPGVAPIWARVRFAAEKSYVGYLSDLDVLWQHAMELPDQALALRCAFVASTLGGLAERLAPEMLAGLVDVGAWPAALATDYVETMGVAKYKAAAIAQLGQVNGEGCFGRLLAMIQDLGQDWSKATALQGLAPSLPEALLPEAHALSLTLPDRLAAKTLVTYLPRLQSAVIEDICDATRAGRFGDGTPDVVEALLARDPRARLSPFDWLRTLGNKPLTRTLAALVGTADRDDWPALRIHLARTDSSGRARVLARAAVRWSALVGEVENELVAAIQDCAARGTVCDVVESLRHLPAPTIARIAATPQRFIVVNDRWALVELLVESWNEGDLAHGALEQALGHMEPTCKFVALLRLCRRLEDLKRDTARVWEAAIIVLGDASAKLPPDRVRELAVTAPAELLPQALAAARRAGISYNFLYGLAARAGELPFDVLEEARELDHSEFARVRRARLAAAPDRTVVDMLAEDHFAPSTIREIGAGVPAENRAEVVRGTLELADPKRRTEALFACMEGFGTQAPELFSSAEAVETIVEWLSSFGTRDYDNAHHGARWAAVRRLPPAQQALLFARATEAVPTFDDDGAVGYALDEVLRACPTEERAQLLDSWLRGAPPERRVRRIGALASASGDSLQTLIAAARELDPCAPRWRARLPVR